MGGQGGEEAQQGHRAGSGVEGQVGQPFLKLPLQAQRVPKAQADAVQQRPLLPLQSTRTHASGF